MTKVTIEEFKAGLIPSDAKKFAFMGLIDFSKIQYPESKKEKAIKKQLQEQEDLRFKKLKRGAGSSYALGTPHLSRDDPGYRPPLPGFSRRVYDSIPIDYYNPETQAKLLGMNLVANQNNALVLSHTKGDTSSSLKIGDALVKCNYRGTGENSSFIFQGVEIRDPEKKYNKSYFGIIKITETVSEDQKKKLLPQTVLSGNIYTGYFLAVLEYEKNPSGKPEEDVIHLDFNIQGNKKLDYFDSSIIKRNGVILLEEIEPVAVDPNLKWSGAGTRIHLFVDTDKSRIGLAYTLLDEKDPLRDFIPLEDPLSEYNLSDYFKLFQEANAILRIQNKPTLAMIDDLKTRREVKYDLYLKVKNTIIEYKMDSLEEKEKAIIDKKRNIFYKHANLNQLYSDEKEGLAIERLPIAYKKELEKDCAQLMLQTYKSIHAIENPDSFLQLTVSVKNGFTSGQVQYALEDKEGLQAISNGSIMSDEEIQKMIEPELSAEIHAMEESDMHSEIDPFGGRFDKKQMPFRKEKRKEIQSEELHLFSDDLNKYKKW